MSSKNAAKAAVAAASESNVAVTKQTVQSFDSDSVDVKSANNFSGKTEIVFQALILALICILAFMTRLFSVVRYESVIHEFDPWFNYRTTQYLVREGFYNFHNWFDQWSWYPLGRFVGGTVYPGLMVTAGFAYHILHFLHVPIDIRNVCVFTAPTFAAFTSLATYGLASESWNNSAGLFAAIFIAIAPGYISRSVAGSYDNEAVAIFALVFCFYLWVRAVHTGSITWSAAAALGYFYMVSAWGGYIFIINLIPAHVLILLLAGRYSHRLYVAYCVFYPLGTLLSMQIQFVSFQPVNSPEHLAAFGVFGLLQLYNFFFYIKSNVSENHFKVLVRFLCFVIGGVVVLLLLLALSGQIPFLTGRLYSLLGATPSLAIIKSVSEHQPSPWTHFFFDLHCLLFLVPVGMYFCFEQLTDANIFSLLYLLFSSYFSSIMIRLILVLAPAVCVMASIGASVLYQTFSEVLVSPHAGWLFTSPTAPTTTGTVVTSTAGDSIIKRSRQPNVTKPVALVILAALTLLFGLYTVHCNWVTSSAYSSPSIVLLGNSWDGSKIVFDDFREAYQWLAHNTPEDAKILSWWDYGYQITGMGNRTVIVDNNTRNNTHIATVGLVMASNEERAYPVLKQLDVDYLLVVFGGKIGYASDDINKFLWMVRISGGVFPEVVESDYFNEYGQYRIDNTASQRMRNSLMYKMCYYRFANQYGGYGAGQDRVRGSEVGEKDIQLTHIEEAFTSEHWMVRIYKVRDEKTHPNFLEKLSQKQQNKL